MASIIDYALLNANKDFESLPFSKIDGLILAQLSYLHFGDSVPGFCANSDGVPLSNIAEYEDYDSLFPLARTAEQNKRLLNAVAYSKRYGKIRANFYRNKFIPEKDTQFSAVTFIINPDLAFIAFRGTDSTITGWKENFNMLYTSPVASQRLSVPYLEEVANRFDGNLILAGHSKGGNLAIYSAVMCSDDIKPRIIEIQSFDNPGFSEEFINSKKYLDTVGKIVKIVPEESLIGMLLNNRGNYRVIKSNGVGVYQHNPFMWLVDGNDFEIGDEVLAKAKFIDGTLNEWYTNFDPKQRELFIESVFKIIEATNAQNAATFSEWSENLKGNTSLVVDTLKGLDPETRNIILKVFGNFFVSAKDSAVSTQKYILKQKIKKIPLISNEL